MAAVGPQILPASATNYRLIWLLSKILSAVSANVLNVKSTFTHKLNASIWERIMEKHLQFIGKRVLGAKNLSLS